MASYLEKNYFLYITVDANCPVLLSFVFVATSLEDLL
jgi:hypothetical protein